MFIKQMCYTNIKMFAYIHTNTQQEPKQNKKSYQSNLHIRPMTITTRRRHRILSSFFFLSINEYRVEKLLKD